MTGKILINLLILFYILQRISEMIISQRNIKKLQKEMKVSIFEEEAKRMKVLHSLWFLFLIVEANLNFKEYKTSTLKMIKSLKLVDMSVLHIERIKDVFNKL